MVECTNYQFFSYTFKVYLKPFTVYNNELEIVCIIINSYYINNKYIIKHTAIIIVLYGTTRAICMTCYGHDCIL